MIGELLKRIPLQYKLIAAGAIVLTLGAAFWLHGFLKYREGKADCRAAQAQAALDTTLNTLKTREAIDHETDLMPDAAVDADLMRLGIMRRPDDR